MENILPWRLQGILSYKEGDLQDNHKPGHSGRSLFVSFYFLAYCVAWARIFYLIYQPVFHFINVDHFFILLIQNLTDFMYFCLWGFLNCHKILDYIFLLASISLTFCPTLHFHSIDSTKDSTKNRIRLKLEITMEELRWVIGCRLGDCHTEWNKWNKSDRERQVSHTIYMWNL